MKKIKITARQPLCAVNGYTDYDDTDLNALEGLYSTVIEVEEEFDMDTVIQELESCVPYIAGWNMEVEMIG